MPNTEGDHLQDIQLLGSVAGVPVYHGAQEDAFLVLGGSQDITMYPVILSRRACRLLQALEQQWDSPQEEHAQLAGLWDEVLDAEEDFQFPLHFYWSGNQWGIIYPLAVEEGFDPDEEPIEQWLVVEALHLLEQRGFRTSP